jgi:hypothetical protein
MADNDSRRRGSPSRGRSGLGGFNFVAAATLRWPVADKK